MTEPDRPASSQPPPPPGAYREGESSGAGLRWGGASPPPPSSPPPSWPDDDAPPPRDPAYPWQRREESEPAFTAEVGGGFARNAWQIALLILFMGVAGIPLVIGGIIAAIDPNMADDDLLTVLVSATIAIDLVAFVLVPLHMLGGWRAALATMRLRPPAWSTLGWALAGTAISFVAIGAYLGIVDVIGVDALEPVSAIDDSDIWENVHLVVLTGILAILVAPIAEEIFYRGFMLGSMARRWGIVPAVVVSALVFSAVHFDVGSLIPFAIIGVVFALVYIRSRNLTSTILAHMMFNTIAFAATIADRGIG